MNIVLYRVDIISITECDEIARIPIFSADFTQHCPQEPTVTDGHNACSLQPISGRVGTTAVAHERHEEECEECSHFTPQPTLPTCTTLTYGLVYIV